MRAKEVPNCKAREGDACIQKMDFGTPGLIHGWSEVAVGKGFAARDGMLVPAKVNQEQGASEGLIHGANPCQIRT